MIVARIKDGVVDNVEVFKDGSDLNNDCIEVTGKRCGIGWPIIAGEIVEPGPSEKEIADREAVMVERVRKGEFALASRTLKERPTLKDVDDFISAKINSTTLDDGTKNELKELFKEMVLFLI